MINQAKAKAQIEQLEKDFGIDIKRVSLDTISDAGLLAGYSLDANIFSLKILYNRISDLTLLKGLTNLTSLYLGHNEISDLAPLKGLTNLTSLYLEGNAVSDTTPINGLVNLTKLYLN